MNKNEILCSLCGSNMENVVKVAQPNVALKCFKCLAKVGNVEATVEGDSATETEAETKPPVKDTLDPNELLPKKFLADDPEFVDHRMRPGGLGARVLLPDGKGGVNSVDRNVVRIEHRGKLIDLQALPPEQRRRRQIVVNLVSIVIGAIFILLFFLLAF